ncbi:MAG: tRNA pseudouridine(38-40) synthase TruA [Casimicrobiaceae bacterium]
MTRYAMAVEYDGRAFCGFQSQPSACGVQDALAAAIGAIAAEKVTVVGAGRTDAGVHATSQIVHFDADTQRPDSAWTRGVNALLPQAVAALWATPVPEPFHARFAAHARHYTYLLQNRAQRAALDAGRVGWYHRPLDLAAMREAAALVTGTHDFSAFRAAQCQAKTPLRNLWRCEIAQSGTLFRFEFSADGFLHHMIRNLLGAFIAVGSAGKPPAWMGTLLAARERARGAATFAADGLYFCGADYADHFGLPPTRRDVVDLAPA